MVCSELGLIMRLGKIGRTPFSESKIVCLTNHFYFFSNKIVKIGRFNQLLQKYFVLLITKRKGTLTKQETLSWLIVLWQKDSRWEGGVCNRVGSLKRNKYLVLFSSWSHLGRFHPSYDIFRRSGAKGCSHHRFRARTPTWLHCQPIANTLHQHRANNQYRTANQT